MQAGLLHLNVRTSDLRTRASLLGLPMNFCPFCRPFQEGGLDCTIGQGLSKELADVLKPVLKIFPHHRNRLHLFLNGIDKANDPKHQNDNAHYLT